MEPLTTLGQVSLDDFWERQAESWVRWAREPGHDSYWRFHRDRFLELLPPPGRLTVDVGGGEGRLARDLKAHGHTVLAIDRSPTMVQEYFRALEQAGLLVERVREIEDSTKDPAQPSVLRWRRIPLFLHIRAVAG